MDAIVISVRTGKVRERPRPEWDQAQARTWHTAYGKEECPGPVRVGLLGIEGDEHGEPDVHGGPEQVVLAYGAAHYASWREQPGLGRMAPGGFGENFTVEGLDETSVCIGDEWAIGEVRLQVSKPRGPCSSISRWWNSPELLKRVVATGRTGWYHRVLREGVVERGMTMSLVARPHAEWTAARVNELVSGRVTDAAAARTLSDCRDLSLDWRQKFARMSG